MKLNKVLLLWVYVCNVLLLNVDALMCSKNDVVYESYPAVSPHT